MSNDVIRVEALSKTYKKRIGTFWEKLFRPTYELAKAVDEVSFRVEKGESVAFLGPNGAGKTTTTKMLTGLIYPSAGSATVLGYEPFERKRDFLCSIGLVMGNKAGLNWDLTARQSFSLLQKMYGIPANDFSDRVSRYSVLLRVDHKLDTQVRRLSLGERMKLELIGAILHNPKILFLDEPTIGLDIESKHALRDFLKSLHKDQGITMILTSHDMDDIEAVCERVVIINHGQIIHDGNLDEVTKKYRDERYIRLLANESFDVSKLEKVGQIQKVNDEKTGCLLVVAQKDLPKALSQLPKIVSIADITIETTPLEKIIADLYAQKKA